MPRYVARIELNGPPPPSVYDKLREQMATASFQKTVTADTGDVWLLPDGLYVGILVTDDVAQARQWIKANVDAVWSSSEIIVFRYSEAAWNGLFPLS